MRSKRGATLIELVTLLFFIGAFSLFVAGLALTKREEALESVH